MFLCLHVQTMTVEGTYILVITQVHLEVCACHTYRKSDQNPSFQLRQPPKLGFLPSSSRPATPQRSLRFSRNPSSPLHLRIRAIISPIPPLHNQTNDRHLSLPHLAGLRTRTTWHRRRRTSGGPGHGCPSQLSCDLIGQTSSTFRLFLPSVPARHGG